MIFPKNKEYFKKLIPFAQRVISICQENGIQPVIYGSLAHFYYTKDKNMKVNDLDILIPEKDFPKMMKLLRKNKIKFGYFPEYDSDLNVTKGKLKIEIDKVGTGYKTLKEHSVSKNIFNKIDFYGIEAKMITLKQLEEIYAVAYNRSREDKAKIMKKIKHLEKFLGRKINNPIKIEIKKNKNLSKSEKDLINKNRIKEFNDPKDFKRDYEPETLWFFLKNKNKVVALGGLRPITVSYLGKTYKLGGICSIISIIKGKGYGKFLMSSLVDYSRTTGKTILGFTGKTKFFKKAYLETKKNFIRRFIYKNPKSGEEIIDNDGDGIYYEGKDKFISKVLSGKKPVYINVLHW
jgi:hypothetical protein